MADDMGLPPMPEGEGKENNGPAMPDFPIEGLDAGAGMPSMEPGMTLETPSIGGAADMPLEAPVSMDSAPKTEEENPFLDKSFFKTPVSLQREKDLADKLVITQSSLQKKEIEINEVKEKLQRELEESRVKFDAQKQELKKEIDTYRDKLAKEKEQWNKIVSEKENEVRRIRETLNGKDQLVNDKIVEVETELRSKMSREHTRLADEKKSLEKRNNELESRLKEIEGGWKKKEQEVRDLQEKALNELKNAEEKLQEEREKTWLKTLKAKEEEINSMKVELTLQESKIRAVLEKKQEEVKEIEEKAGKSIKDRSDQIVKEKESILEALAAREREINTLKESFADREKYLAGKVEEAEMDGKLALAKFDQELKEREKNLWVEREEWITVLKTQFKEKERELKEQLGKDRAAVEKREEELKGLFGQEKAALQEQLEQERGSLRAKEAELRASLEKEKAELKERESAFDGERDKLLALLSAKDGEIKGINTELKRVLEEREKEFEELRNRIGEAAKIKETELADIRLEYTKVTEGREKEIEVLKAEIRNVLAAREREVAAARAETKAAQETKEKEKEQLAREFLDKEAELRRKAYELEARALDAVKKVADNDELWKQKIILKENELAAEKAELARRETAFRELLSLKEMEIKEAEESFNAEKAALAEKLSLKDYEFSSEIAKKEQELSALEEKSKETEGAWQTRFEQQKNQLYAKLSEKDESSFKQMEEIRLLVVKLKTEEDALLRKEQEYQLFVSQFEAKERQYKKLLEDQAAGLRKLEEERAADYKRGQEKVKNLENAIAEKDNEKRRLETELNIRNGVIFEKDEKLRELELNMRRLEHDKMLFSEDLARSRLEVNRVKEGSIYELSGIKEDNERLQKVLAEKNSVIENLRSTLARLNEEAVKVEREYTKETTGKTVLISELERVKAELAVLKEQGRGDNVITQLNDKDTIIKSLNETISKIEKEKAAIKDLILEKSKAEEEKDKEIKELVDTVSNLTEDKNKFEFKTKELEADRETALNQLSQAQGELTRLLAEADSLRTVYETRLEDERKKITLEIEKVKRETEEFNQNSCRQFEVDKNQLLAEIDRLKAEVITTGNILGAEKKENQMKLEQQRIAFEEELKKKALELENLSGTQKTAFEEELKRRIEEISFAKEEEKRVITEELNNKVEELSREKEAASRSYEERMAELKAELEKRDGELNEIKGGINTNLEKLNEQSRLIEELKNEMATAGDNLRLASEETASAKEILKNKDVENQKLQMELGGLVTRSEELSKLAEQKDNQISNLVLDFNGKLEALAEALKAKELDLAAAKEKVGELQHRIEHDYEIKEEELKLGISRLQMQMKETVGRYETELKAEKQKLQAIQAEYALRDAQWTSQKDKEKETRGQMADMEASYAKLKKDFSDNTAKFTAELGSAAAKISTFEARVRENEEKIQMLDKENDIIAAQLKKEMEEKEKLLKKQADVEKSLRGLSNSLKNLRKRFKFVLWLWYPNEPRN